MNTVIFVSLISFLAGDCPFYPATYSGLFLFTVAGLIGKFYIVYLAMGLLSTGANAFDLGE